MFQRIYDTILAAKHDPLLIPIISNLAQEITDWEDSEIDRLLDLILGLGDDLKLSEPLTGEGRVKNNCLDLVLQPIIHFLVVREIRAKRVNHLKGKSLSEPDSSTTRNPTVARGTERATEKQSRSVHSQSVHSLSEWSPERIENVEAIYQLTPAASDLRNHLLRWLATAGTAASLALWLDLVCDNPPENRLGIGLAFAPLMQPNFAPTEQLLKRLLEKGTAHSQIAPATFDLFNFYFRSKRVSVHPASNRLAPLAELLGQLCIQLGRVESGEFPPSFQAREINQLVSDSVALIVALCDAFALNHYHAAVDRIHQALQLRHRRVQTEAAAALARLGDEQGKKALIALADQPIARLRVLAYAEELGFKQEISLELQGDIAVAESQLAIWLSEPDQMGLAPSKLELLDHRKLAWPSYEEPIGCYLFRYAYGSGESSHSNIGICGPLTHAFSADLRHLPVDEMYAAFAGWQTIHDEIFQMTESRARQAFPNQFRRLEGSLEVDDYEDLRIETVGSFFGELVLVASAIHEGKFGTLIVDSHDSSWFDLGNSDAPVDFKLAYSIWRGKQLLNRFNSSDSPELS